MHPQLARFMVTPTTASAVTPVATQSVAGNPAAKSTNATARPLVAKNAQSKPAIRPASRPVTQATATSQRPTASQAAVVTQPATATSTPAIWKEFFNNWPEGIPTRGIVVNQLNEQLPFKAYMVKGDVVMLERTNPDTLGSRYILVPYSEISIVKLTDPLNQEKFDKAGFKGKLCS